MEKVAPNSKFVGHFTEIILQRKTKGPLTIKQYSTWTSEYARLI